MAVVVASSGQQAHTIGVAHTLATITSPGNYQLVMDFESVADDEAFEISYYTKARSTDAERRSDVFSVKGKGADPIKRFALISTPHHLKVTSKQVNGTGRSIPWAIYQL